MEHTFYFRRGFLRLKISNVDHTCSLLYYKSPALLLIEWNACKFKVILGMVLFMKYVQVILGSFISQTRRWELFGFISIIGSFLFQPECSQSCLNKKEVCFVCLIVDSQPSFQTTDLPTPALSFSLSSVFFELSTTGTFLQASRYPGHKVSMEKQNKA